MAANEFDPAASDTIRLNAPSVPLYSKDIRDVTPNQLLVDLDLKVGELFAIVGGPPCQAFSTAGRRLGLNDRRGNVFLHFLDIINTLQPKYAVFENVRGLLSAPINHIPHLSRGTKDALLTADESPGGALKLILTRLRRAGYSVTFNLYNTANFGVPQSRERLIFIASRDGQQVPHLQPTHDAEGADGLLRWTTLRDAISPLADIKHHHVSFPPKRLEYYKLLRSGQNWRDLPLDVQPAAMGESLYSGGGKTGFYRRLAWDKPSPTLVTRPNMKATDLCHPSSLRPLSIEEYSAIQTFPGDYHVSGTLDDQYRQLGNAVPCLFAQVIGRHISNFERGIVPATRRTARFSRYINTDERTWVGAARPGLFDIDEREVA